jgi:glycosyltransferase involved in cell wall biosynthesis
MNTKSEKKSCLIISASNIQNTRIRKALFYFLENKFDELNFCGDSIVADFEHQIEWKDAYNRKGKIFELVIFYRLILLIIKNRPTHIISFAPKVNIYCGILTRIFKIKHTAIISGLGSYASSITRRGSILFNLFKFSLKTTDLILTMNESNFKFCQETLGIDKVRRIPSEGLDTKVMLSHSNANTDKVSILYLSRIISEKGIFLLIEAFKNLHANYPDTELLIAGEMSLSEENGEKDLFFDNIKSSGINYQGEVTEELKRQLLEQADIVVLASMYGEGLPMILLEAQLFGSIIITTNVPGCNDAVSPEMQRFYCDYTVDSLETNLINALNLSDDERKNITSSSSSWVKENHDINHVNLVYDSYFSEKSFYSI